MMLQTKYQGSRPCGFRQEDFFTFPHISVCLTCDPRGGAILAPPLRKFNEQFKKFYFIIQEQDSRTGHELLLSVQEQLKNIL